LTPKETTKLTSGETAQPRSVASAKERALAFARALDEKGGIDICVLDLSKIGAFADFFVVATATSDRHARTLANAAEEAARAVGERPRIEGESVGRWVLVDSVDVVVHVFQDEARGYYSLERLWGEAERIEFAGAGNPPQ
jgi:ribosome-associated protein